MVRSWGISVMEIAMDETYLKAVAELITQANKLLEDMPAPTGELYLNPVPRWTVAELEADWLEFQRTGHSPIIEGNRK